MGRRFLKHIHAVAKDAPVFIVGPELCLAFDHDQDHFAVAGDF